MSISPLLRFSCYQIYKKHQQRTLWCQISLGTEIISLKISSSFCNQSANRQGGRRGDAEERRDGKGGKIACSAINQNHVGGEPKNDKDIRQDTSHPIENPSLVCLCIASGTLHRSPPSRFIAAIFATVELTLCVT